MNIVALAGGVGGAKLADGLARSLTPESLTVVVNTGDDFEHWGLKICPDLDTVCYTLAGLANPATGWGRADETWEVYSNIVLLGGEDWFRLGDKDLAVHIERTRRLRAGRTLTQIVREFCTAWNLKVAILPMSDDPVPTMVDTLDYGELPFQEYFVQRRCEPRVTGFRFTGIENARPAAGIEEAIERADAVLFCPSNPWVSIDPILRIVSPSLPRNATTADKSRKKPVVAVSPIIGGKTVKGPAAKMFAELGIEPSALSVAKHYGSTITGFVLDAVDADLESKVKQLGLQTFVTDTLMRSDDDRKRLAQDVLHFVERLVP
jgi:LPPG:FO 2-phospho-L-lactate transferase